MPSGEWPDWNKLEALVTGGNFSSGNELFGKLHEKVKKKGVEDEIRQQAQHAKVVWEFLIGFAAADRKWKMFKPRLLVVVKVLLELDEWAQVLQNSDELQEQLRKLPEELQSVLGAQGEVLAKAISPEALKSMKLGVRAEDTPAQVAVYLAKEQLVAEIQDASKPQEGSSPDANAFDLGAAEEELPGVVSAIASLQDGIDEVTAINGDKQMDASGKGALDKLRIGCIRCVDQENLLQQEAERSPQVFQFLLSYVRRAGNRAVGPVAEVMNLLMASPSWSSTLQASDMLKDDLRKLPKEMQAALGIQNEKARFSGSPFAPCVVGTSPYLQSSIKSWLQRAKLLLALSL
jgi:hypothetical protein